MIDYGRIKPGDKLKIVGMGAPGFAKLGDIVTVESCTAARLGRCDVRHDVTGETAYFALACGANRLELVEAHTNPPQNGRAECDEPNRCRAGRDGDCNWRECPQEADGRKNYQPICPLYVPDPEE